MFFKKVPRSNWPDGCFRVTAWHKNEHILKLMGESDRIIAELGLTPGTSTIDSRSIAVLATRAVATADVYIATACLEPLYDAYESFPEIVEVFEEMFATSTLPSRERICCCLGYILAGGINRRDPMGRPFTEVNADYAHFQGLWQRAESLRLSLGFSPN